MAAPGMTLARAPAESPQRWLKAARSQQPTRNSADKKMLIKLKKVSDGATEIRIRVGTFGDESMSRLILDKIKSHF